MDLDWLQDILCLETTRSFTQAAEQRNVTQSALSRRIKALEAWLEAPLIDRSSYPIRLTPEGEQFLPVARQLLVQLQQARAEMKSRASADERVFRIAAPHSLASNFLAHRLAALHLAGTRLRTKVHSDNTAACFDLLAQGGCELLLSYRYPSIATTLDPSRFTCTDLGVERLVPVAEPGLVRAREMSMPGTPRRPLPYLAYDPSSFLAGVVADVMRKGRERLHLRVRHTDAFAEALKAMCLGGVGLAWLPEGLVADELARGQLVQLGGGAWVAELTFSLFSACDADDEDARLLCAALAGA